VGGFTVKAGDAPLLVSEYSVAADAADTANSGARTANDNFIKVLRRIASLPKKGFDLSDIF
jgi:hypothetical protein